jgi:hypothetical protein
MNTLLGFEVTEVTRAHEKQRESFPFKKSN